MLIWPTALSSLAWTNTVVSVPSQPLSTLCSPCRKSFWTLSDQIIHWLRTSFNDYPLDWTEGQVLLWAYQSSPPPVPCKVSDPHSPLTPLASSLFLKHSNHQAHSLIQGFCPCCSLCLESRSTGHHLARSFTFFSCSQASPSPGDPPRSSHLKWKPAHPEIPSFLIWLYITFPWHYLLLSNT